MSVDVHVVLPALVVAVANSFAEQEGCAPQACQPDDSVNNPAEQCILPTEQPCNEVKLKNANQSPVGTANYR